MAYVSEQHMYLETLANSTSIPLQGWEPPVDQRHLRVGVEEAFFVVLALAGVQTVSG